MGFRGKSIKTEGRTPLLRAAHLCWMRSSFLAAVDITEFQITDAYSSSDLTNMMHNLSIHSGDEKLKVMPRTGPNSLIQ
jgi:hypothetical protein